MPSSSAVRALDRRNDHVCRLVSGIDEFRSAAVEFLARGLDRGERLMYVADRPVDDLVGDLVALGDVDQLVSAGTLTIESTLDVYTSGHTFDPDRQVARYRGLTRDAVSLGYRGLRVAADATAMVVDREARRRFVRYELAADRLMVEEPMSAMCAYDVDIVGPGAAELCAVHPEHDADDEVAPGFRLCFGTHGLRLDGEVDVVNHDLFSHVLDAGVGCAEREVVIDMANLTFIDIRGLGMLAATHRLLAREGRELRLLDPPGVLRRAADLLELDLLAAAAEPVPK